MVLFHIILVQLALCSQIRDILQKHDINIPYEYTHSVTRIGAYQTIRINPIINGIPVLNQEQLISIGTDGVEYHKNHYQPSKVVTADAVGVQEAIQVIQGYHHLFSTPVESQQILYPVEDKLHMAWRIYERSSPITMSHVWIVDAVRKELIGTYPRVHHDKAMIYPAYTNPSLGSAPGVIDIGSTLATNLSIKGADFQSSNTCFAYKCFDGSRSCDLDQAYCVDANKTTKRDVDYYALSSIFTVDGREIDYYHDWQADGYINNTIYMAWDKAPVVASRLNYTDGVWGSDTDFHSYTGTEFTDSFSELQIYYFLTLHAKFLRNLLGNDTFCFTGSGTNCTIADPIGNSTGILSGNGSPIRFLSNYQILNTDNSNSVYADFQTQLNAGLGKNATKPVMFDQSQGYADAFYHRSPFFDPSNKNCTDGGCLLRDNYPYTYFVFGQNSYYDWGLNDCIVFHELTHALVGQFIPELPSYVWGSTGLRSDPGAMNEAWADYFAAIDCQQSDFTKTYNGHPKRNLNNDYTCVDGVGEVHTDGMLFSGALWKVRNQILNSGLTAQDQTTFDREIVLRALTLGHATDMFATQLQLVLDLLAKHPTLNPLTSYAKDIFNTREFNCERVKLFTEQMDPTFTLPHPGITSANISTIPTLIKFIPRRSDWSGIMRWRQWSVSGWAGNVDTGYGALPLQVLISPCFITLSNSTYNGTANCDGNNQSLEWQFTSYSNLYGSISFSFQNTDQIYMVLASTIPSEMILYSSSVTFYGFNRIWRLTFMILSLFYIPVFFYIPALAIVRAFRKIEYPRKLYLMVFISAVLGILSGLSSLFATLFGIVREYLTYVMFIFSISKALLDIFIIRSSGYTFHYGNFSNLKFNKSEIIFQGIIVLINLVALLITALYSTPTAVHVIFYVLFLLLFLGNYITFIGIIRNIVNTLIPIQTLESMDNVEGINLQ
ncbi:hypothetical protein HDV06_000626 [Boothiomyces sp. JEL0866]|nr:hypothetical protein HDV06_000626 [Boothiomyces sp. JEL0866]